ncbi:conserved Plasmodium protein, unknown function [Plasmodium knowlesi strain H]|uniref:Uncharacterized protein n=3 Tax=Plasmodium knowlesi TaxID=5850 RepID=A0A5K1UIC7_PLAKH|nr:uncharacterized protein PKNH_0318500 [Plasmodium knowlesi strain H]OTN68583.1 Uncharacterized protein PKNOH_S02310900 [Plasmodium knowlesi]CAA9986610.1 protein CPH1, putative [Plasmodium knowlesi strain H]SBO24113.1 conserved Plasmodium protein, unknown function [Plasmodium knowlesi strain H]SBO29321.1 conserved Plasmodium protein, unknown function [Plasmodium knowlesi strain H]VVS76084.1 protein CPH1, putative [Plasmodium knowlesi strain H]|eukprot:XP_002261150.1 [Plasmodium knowlesi strain H]
MDVEGKTWCDRKLLKFEGICRGRNNSIHNHLVNNDVVAAIDQLKKGTSPFVRDECNRTALDLAIVLFMGKFNESLCTSLIADYMHSNVCVSRDSSLAYSDRVGVTFRGKVPFYHSKGLFNVANETSATENSSDSLSPFPLATKKKSWAIPYKSHNYQHGYKMGMYKKNTTPPPKSLATSGKTKHTQALLDGRLRRMKALLLFIKMLSMNTRLRKYAERVAKEEIVKLSFPFLYTNTMHMLFNRFSPEHGQVKKWNIKNPADSRRLVTKILCSNLFGSEVIKFMGNILSCFSSFIGIFGEKVYLQDSIISQYILHMSFTFDNEYLFNVVVNKENTFAQKDLFHWDGLINSISHEKHSSSHYYQPLLYARLNKFFLERLEQLRDGAKGGRGKGITT